MRLHDLALLLGCALLLAGCGHTGTAATREVKSPSGHPANGDRVSQVELQQDIERVATAFMERVAQAGEHAADGALEPARRQELFRHVLLYNASALDIATGPFPELNTLDMLVFAMLGRNALEQHWIPRKLGVDGKPLLTAFAGLERDMWNVAPKILDEKGALEVRELVSNWKRENPHQFRVEGVRFQEFSGFAAKIEASRAESARGLLRKVQAATQIADQALLMGERAFFVAHRLPFLIRLQGRVGVQETLDDSLAPSTTSRPCSAPCPRYARCSLT